MVRNDYIYDEETLPNIFTLAVRQGDQRWMFEISQWENDTENLITFLTRLHHQSNARMVGFNNVGFDYPVLHLFINEYHKHPKGEKLAYRLWQKANEIIEGDDRFAHTIWGYNQYIPQVDLYLIHHFDNRARSTSLKLLEFNMRRSHIEELPFEPNVSLKESQRQTLLDYNWEDVDATFALYNETLSMIEFREQMSEQYHHNFINYNDTKIGKQYIINQLEEMEPGCCYTTDDDGKRVPRQTLHEKAISLAEVIFPYIQFQHPEFQRILEWFKCQSILGAYDRLPADVYAEVNGFKFGPFGLGGLHGSINDTIVRCTADYAIIDLDVKGYYPALGVANRLYPAHLGERFVDIYTQIAIQRNQHAKGTPINRMLKLAQNGVFGDTGNVYSPFYDLNYMLSITINGQLLLCMLAEYLLQIPGLQMIQVNTDGLTVHIPRSQLNRLETVKSWWENYTLLQLEEVEYNRMFIRDCNNYLAESLTGEIKRKGAYENQPPADRNPTGWHQNLSALVVPLAAEAYLIKGTDPEQFIRNHPDIMDFMLRTKVGRKDKLEIHYGMHSEPLQRITRYLVTNIGGSLLKLSPPPAGHRVGQWKRASKISNQLYAQVLNELRLEEDVWPDYEVDSTNLPWDARINTKNKAQYGVRKTGLSAGWLVTPFNRIDSPIDRSIINFQYYIQETNKLLDGFR